MTRKILILVFLLAIIPSVWSRKKVAVVLSGGGAKGAAHVGALRVIEKAGIPIDMVIGTSMGSIVGSLYCLGYTPDQLDTLLTHQNWIFLLSNQNTETQALSLEDKLTREQYIVNIGFTKPNDVLKRSGLVQGRNVSNLLNDLMVGYTDSIDFGTLPIPFACVSYDLASGQEYVFHQGKLPLAVRSSMSIPGFFSPVKYKGKMLVDGGVFNNYPADVAKAMGADIIIGIDVQEDFSDINKLNNVTNILQQTMNILGKEKYEKNLDLLDLDIKCPLFPDYNTASYTNEDLRDIIQIGQDSTLARWDDLIALKEEIGLTPSDTIKVIPSNYDKGLKARAERNKRDKPLKEVEQGLPPNTLNVGFRFDSEEKTALKANTKLKLGKRSNYLDATLRLGKQSSALLGISMKASNLWKVSTEYCFETSDYSLYSNGIRKANLEYTHQYVNFMLSRSWRSLKLNLALSYDDFDTESVLLDRSSPLLDHSQQFISYTGELLYNSLDKQYFPTSGQNWTARVDNITDNFVSYEDNTVYIAAFNFEQVKSLNNNLTFIYNIYGRSILSRSFPFFLQNSIGGLYFGKYTHQQMPFNGVMNTNMVKRSIVANTLNVRYRIKKLHYITAGASFGVQQDSFEMDQISDFFDLNGLFGYNIGYSFSSPIGPLSAFFYGNTQADNQFGLFVSAGFNF